MREVFYLQESAYFHKNLIEVCHVHASKQRLQYVRLVEGVVVVVLAVVVLLKQT